MKRNKTATATVHNTILIKCVSYKENECAKRIH